MKYMNVEVKCIHELPTVIGFKQFVFISFLFFLLVRSVQKVAYYSIQMIQGTGNENAAGIGRICKKI